MQNDVEVLHETLRSNHARDVSRKPEKVMLATLLNDMKTTYAIPMQRDSVWEQENENVFTLYRQISARRDWSGESAAANKN